MNLKLRSPKACFVYYMQFSNSALLYREAKALQNQGFVVDVFALRSSRNEKIIQNFNGLNIYGIQARPCAEKSAAIYFAKLLIFFLKSLIILSALAAFKR